MGIFTHLTAVLSPPPAPVYTPIAFANVGEALLAIDDADPLPGHLALRIARAFTATACGRLGATEADVWQCLIAAPADWIALLWDGGLWDTLAFNLFGDLGVTVRPTLH